MPVDMIFALIVGWALGIATAILWPRGKALPPLGGPPRIGGYQPRPSGRGQPTNLPQGTGAVPRSQVIVQVKGQPTSDDFVCFREHIEKWLDQQERQV